MTRRLPRPVRIYRVGGSVRDELLGRPAGDRDWVVVGATPEIMLASGYKPVGKDFPVFLHPETGEEYALARTERKEGRGYRGFAFFATPDVTLDEDLARRDLTINAMARAPDGSLIDPHGGEADLRAGILRHVAPAFAEDPLRVLRVARFAARLGFRIADTTLALMRDIVERGELATIAGERVWQELARGLSEAYPSRLVATLRKCGALRALVPEVDALYAIALAGDNAGTYTERALDWSAAHGLVLPARYAILTQELDRVRGRGKAPVSSTRTGMARTESVSRRLKAPLECRDAARLAVRWHRTVACATSLAPAGLLDLITATDALRRPERLDTLLASTAAHVAAQARRRAKRDEPPLEAVANLLREAVAVVRNVNAAQVAEQAVIRSAASSDKRAAGAAIAAALRSARLAALRRWRRERN